MTNHDLLDILGEVKGTYILQVMKDYTNNLCTTRPKSVNKIMLHRLKQAAEMGNEEARLTLKTINK